MNTTENSINQIIEALMKLEAKGCHSVFFEYRNGLFCIRIFRNETETVVYEWTINIIDEPLRLDEAVNKIKDLENHVTKTVFQCYKREFINGEKSGEWKTIRPVFEFGENATSEMMIDGSGYYITDPDNDLQYFVDMKQENKTN